MSSELLGSAENALKGNLGGAWDILSGYADAYTDLGIGKKFGGAAAAYSLRDVGAMNGPVVRVRRDSDNSEQDFSALAVPFIPEWCNRQVIKPLDVKALQSDGRTGDFIIAKAAYSLRSLGDRQATVAATNDTVARADGKYVVQVRRSSDDTIKSFKADEVTDGTLVAFVNEDVTIYQSDFSAGVDGFASGTTTLTGNQDAVSDEAGTTKDDVLKVVKDSDTQGYFQKDQGVVAGLSYTVSGTFFAPTSNTAVDGLIFKDGVSGSTLSNFASGYLTSSGVWTDFSFSYTAAVSGTARINLGISSLGSNPTASSTGSAGDIVYISNLKFVETTSNGFVRTWYDQSVTDEGGGTGNAHHAIQATAANQPTIVSNGSLVADNGIDFDDSSEHSLVATSVSGMEAKLSVFSTSVRDSTGYTVSLSNSSNSSKYFAIQEGGSNSTLNTRNTTSVTASPSVSGNTRLTFGLTTGDTVTSAGALGGALTTDTTDYGSAFGSGDLDQIIIGKLRTVSPSATHFFEGRIREILVYASSATGDQTDNRGAFEANIAEHYNISGVPTEDNEVNGFVETWYDQSGNGNDATQTTATKQPKIVNSGSLLTDGILFGANINLPLSGTGLDVLKNVAHGNVFSVLKPLVTGTGNGRYFGASINGGTTARFLFADSQATNASFRIGGRSLDGDSFTDLEGTTTHSNAVSLLTGFINYGTKTATLFLNGSQIDTSTLANMTAGNTSNTSSDDVAIGDFASSGSNTSDFNAKEIIFFNTDKSSDRADIESNIANHYGITLS
jgi:DNA-directed RNA polymerase subunit H (RpoH/RPB5)